MDSRARLAGYGPLALQSRNMVPSSHLVQVHHPRSHGGPFRVLRHHTEPGIKGLPSGALRRAAKLLQQLLELTDRLR